ncbi:MAG: MIP family channel protein [Peptococcaceae bacterium]|nr:MIP family channel protein [Peptococcaceae bacterium]
MKKYIAEFIGTMVLVIFGCGTAAATGVSGADPNGAYILTALAFGLSIVAMAYSIGNVSGCHVNPAVSVGVFLAGKMTSKDFVGYVVAQFLGAIVGAAILAGLLGVDTGLGANGLFDASIGKSLIAEIILTFVFVMAVLGATDKIANSTVAGLVIGLSLTLVHILGISLTGTSVNPARSFGPALFVGGDAFSIVWIFIVAPVIGSALAAVVYKYLTSGQEA